MIPVGNNAFPRLCPKSICMESQAACGLVCFPVIDSSFPACFFSVQAVAAPIQALASNLGVPTPFRPLSEYYLQFRQAKSFEAPLRPSFRAKKRRDGMYGACNGLPGIAADAFDSPETDQSPFYLGWLPVTDRRLMARCIASWARCIWVVESRFSTRSLARL